MITVTGVPDGIADGDVPYTIFTAPADQLAQAEALVGDLFLEDGVGADEDVETTLLGADASVLAIDGAR